jgi:hypothetical protein
LYYKKCIIKIKLNLIFNKKNTKNDTTKNNHLYIFDKYVNNNYRLIPFNVKIVYTGETKYLPPVSKE